ncbi:right-handed parallel beta-helix repeat-containing protein [Candidatus Bathyarchaeota archaeon]|nr:right-handed parallel beta-helix repeat-containing protein [Candidatus Bathyarchaeota archaeon]
MARLSLLTTLVALASTATAQCGSGTPDATVTGDVGAYIASHGAEEVYSGDDYLAAVQAAVDSAGEGRVAVMADGNVGTGKVNLPSGVTFEGCGTINAEFGNGNGAISSMDTTDVSIPYLTMTGNPYFGLHFGGTTNLVLGEITMNLSDGMGIRFEANEALNTNVKIGTLTVTGAGSHAIETWNIDGLEIDAVIAKDVGECGLLLQSTTNAHVGLVDGDNVAAGSGYATFRMANRNGRDANGGYETNVYIDKVVSRGGGRGVFCVSESGGVEIAEVDLADNENNAILIENCYNVAILGGTVNGGGEVRLSARDEFAITSDISLTLTVDGTTVRESPCGENISLNISGDAALDVC